MIKDFVPARTSLSSGIVVKQHLLERNKYPQPQMEWEDVTYTGSIEIGEFSGGTGGSFERFNYVENVSQSWNETYITPLGEVTMLHGSQEEFYDGEFSGSHIIVSTQDLNADCEPFKKVNPQGVDYHGVRMYSGSDYNFSSFIDPNNYPTDGYISIWYQKDSISPLPPPNLSQSIWTTETTELSLQYTGSGS